MIYTPLTNRALRIAYEAHADQVDKCGTPYVFHPYHLAAVLHADQDQAASRRVGERPDLIGDIPPSRQLTFKFEILLFFQNQQLIQGIAQPFFQI